MASALCARFVFSWFLAHLWFMVSPEAWEFLGPEDLPPSN